MAGDVLVDEQRIDKVGFLVAPDLPVRVRRRRDHVSRGGDKLAGVLGELRVNELIRGRTVLDVGSSTGGFSDVCLKLGAAKVYAMDIGTNLLDFRLRQDPRVEVLEGRDARDLEPGSFADVSFVVADVSFIGLASLVRPLVAAVRAYDVIFLVLVKPQFELPPHEVPPGGVVRLDVDRHRAVAIVQEAFANLGLKTQAILESPVPGRRGNREIFLCVRQL